MEDQDFVLGYACKECGTEDASVYTTDSYKMVLNHCVLCGSGFPDNAELQTVPEEDVSRLRCENTGFTFYVPKWMTEARDAGLRFCTNCGRQSLTGDRPDTRRRDDAMVNTEHGRERRNMR